MTTETNSAGITPEDFISCSYKRFEQVKHIKEYADFGLQKLISDEKGKKYYIAVFVYDAGKVKESHPSFEYFNKFMYAPGVVFSCSPFVKVEASLGGKPTESSIKDMEETFEKIWITLGSPYYELYH